MYKCEGELSRFYSQVILLILNEIYDLRTVLFKDLNNIYKQLKLFLQYFVMTLHLHEIVCFVLLICAVCVGGRQLSLDYGQFQLCIKVEYYHKFPSSCLPLSTIISSQHYFSPSSLIILKTL